MKTLYLDCGMGAAGDMMTAALLELLPDDEQEIMLEKLNKAGLDGVHVERSRVSKCGIMGSHIDVSINGKTESADYSSGHDRDPESFEENQAEHRHHHTHMSDIKSFIEELDLSDKVKKDALAVYGIIAGAESRVHGIEVSEVHFHEVGMKDAIMDVAAACMLMERISPDRVVASPVHVGSGKVKCAHGIMPVPAPATAIILEGIPIYSTELSGELCTPTGAALLKYFADDFGPMPVIKPLKTGYGMGSRDYPEANCLRIMLGESYGGDGDIVLGLSCNVDDMTGEETGFAMERLYEAGAREVYTVPVGMKKSRPGILLEVLCDPADKDAMLRTIFKYTTTIGVRETVYNRHILDRTGKEKDTEFGKVHLKCSDGYGVRRDKYEYDDISRIAAEEGLSLREIRERLDRS